MSAVIRNLYLLFFIPFLSCCGDDPKPLVIGAVLSMTGPGATVGQDIQHGLDLAIEEINQKGGLNGRPLELIVADSASIPQTGAIAFQHLEKSARPFFYITTLSAVSIELKPLAENQQVVLAGIGVAAEEFTTDCQWCFRFWITPRNDMRAFNTHCDRLRLKKIAVLYLDDQFGSTFLREITREAALRGIEVKEEKFQRNEKDVERQISNMMDCDAVFTVSYPAQLENLWTQIRAAGFKGYLITNNNVSAHKVRVLPGFRRRIWFCTDGLQQQLSIGRSN